MKLFLRRNVGKNAISTDMICTQRKKGSRVVFNVKRFDTVFVALSVKTNNSKG